MANSGPFHVGITPDFDSGGAGLLSPALRELLEPAAGVEYETMPDTAGVGDPAVLDRYDGVIAYNYAFPAGSVRGIERLSVLALWGVGFDRVDTAACTEAGVMVALTRDSVARPVAEGIFALIFCLAKRVRTLDIRCRTGRWRQDPPVLADIAGRALGSVGLGNIAREMFRMASCLGFGQLLACSRGATAADAEAAGVRLADLDTLLRDSDFLAINCPATPQTRHMIGARELALMKPSAYLINTARGAVVDEAALVDVLRRKKIAGAGLDVFESEPVAADNPLLELDNVIVTPHLIARTEACIRDTSRSACRNVLDVARGTPPPYLANPDVLRHPRVRAVLAGRRSC